MREEEELVRRVLEAIPNGAVHIAREGSVRSANAEALRILGYDHAELKKRHVADWATETITEDGTPCAVADFPVQRVLASGEPDGPRTLGVRRPSGNIAWVVCRAVPFAARDGELDGVIMTLTDITERRAVETRARQSEQEWRSFAENIPDFAVIVDHRGQILQINRVIPELASEKVIGTSVFDFVDEAYRAEYKACFERVLETGESAQLEIRARGARGTAAWYETVFVPLVEQDHVARILMVARDTTERKRAEEALRRSEEKWRVLVASIPDFIGVVDREGRLLQVNRLHPQLTEAEVIGRPVFDFIGDRHRDEYRRTLARVVASAEAADLDTQATDPTGITSSYEVKFVPLPVEGQVERVLIVARNVTERVRADEELRASEQKWRLLAANVPDYVSLVDRDARFLSVNRVFPETTEERVLRSTMYDWIPPETIPEYRKTIEAAFESRSTIRFESRGYTQGGSMGWWETIAVPLVEGGRVDRLLVVARDVTDRKRAELAIQQSERKWRALVESLPDQVLVVDRELRILSTNHAGAGDAGAAVIGARVDAFVDDMMVDEWRHKFATVLETGSAVRLETRAVGPTGALSWFDSILVPLTEDDFVDRVMIVARDVSERRAMLATLAEKERLASVGMVAASVAHEVMNPLTYVLANLDLALGARSIDEQRKHRALVEAREGALRMQQIVWDLRALGRAGSEEHFYVDARSVLESALRLCGPEVGLAERVFLDLEEVTGVVASESRLCQVFINVLVNAAQAMADRPAAEREIHVRTHHDESAGLVGIEIRDRGVGIPRDRVERIFEPFYTTKPTGTGLGLSISRDIIERMGGHITVESAPGVGTTFTVWLSTTRRASAGAAQ